MIESDLSTLPPDDPVDLLERDVFSVELNGERTTLSLAGLLAAIGRGDEVELTRLMPHQRHPMHAFVVQLMAMVAARSGDTRLDRSEAEWRDGLRELAAIDGEPSAEAWQLVVSDLSKPAFLQPPVPEGKLTRFKPIETPDGLDVLVLAKNHDLKQARIRHPRIEHWVYALLSLQTQEGFSGRDNYGIARMNGGFGNRPDFGMTPSLSWSRRIQRDVAAALDGRASALESLPHESSPQPATRLACVWVVPWNGSDSIALGTLDPYFVEICRRVRFASVRGELWVGMTPTKAPRLNGKDYLGNIGDLWIPVDVARGTALTLGGSGLTYARLSDILFSENWKRPKALELRSDDGETPLVTARALVRGQGKTEGLHERVIRIPTKARARLAKREERDKIGATAKGRIERVATLRLRILKPAIAAFLQGGASDLRLDDDRANSLLDSIESQVDAEFFPRLFADVDRDPVEARIDFERWLLELGRAALEQAIQGLPTSAARRERAIAAAEGRFFGAARKHFPEASAPRSARESAAAAESTPSASL